MADAPADQPAEPSSTRPRPQYGEYATPEEVAEARGPLPVEPADPVSRLAAPITRPPSGRVEKVPNRPSPTMRTAPPRAGRPLGARPPRQGNNLITVLLLVFGIWNTVTSIPSYLDFGTVLSQGVELAGYGTVTFGAIAHTAGIVLLTISLLVLIAAVGVSLQLIRDGRRSIWVPIAAGALFLLLSIIVMTFVVANTPALMHVLENRKQRPRPPRPRGGIVRVRVLPRDVASGIITGSVASLGWAIGAATLVLGLPVVLETTARAGRLSAAILPCGLLLLMLVSLGFVVWRARVWAVVAYLVIGFVASTTYELTLLMALPGSIDTQIYLLNRPAVALVLVGLAARTPVAGIGWSALGFVVSTASTLAVSLLGSVPFRPGYGPIVVVVISLAAYLTLWSVQMVQRRRVPNIEELEAENDRLTHGEDLARRTTAAVHDTLLNDLSIVMNAPDTLDARARSRLRQDLETLRGAEWLDASSKLTKVDDQDSSLRNDIMRLISGFQWRGLSVHVTGSGDGIYQLEPAVATALVHALGAALENVVRHSGATVAEVELVYEPESITLMVTDEGVGFDPQAVAADRLGLRASIDARIAAVGGTVQIWSSPGSGTSIAMSVPVRSVLREHDAPHHRELG